MDNLAISGSQVGALMGVSPWMTPLQLYMQLCGELPKQEDNDVLEEGRFFEDAIFKSGCAKFGLRSHPHFVEGVEWRHGPLSGHPDRAVQQDGRLVIVECKHTLYGDVGDEKWGAPDSAQVPPHYRLQAATYQWLHMMESTKVAAPYAYIFARLKPGVTRFVIPVVAEEMEEVEARAHEMIERVRARTPPDAQSGNEADQRLRWLVDPRKKHVADAELLAYLDELAQQSAVRLAAEKREKDLKARILECVEDAAVIVFVGDDLQEREIATVGADRCFDAKAFAMDHPDIVEKYRYQEVDWSGLKKAERKLIDPYFRAPRSTLEQKRKIHLKEKS